MVTVVLVVEEEVEGDCHVDIVSCGEGQDSSQPWRGVKVLIRARLPSNSPAWQVRHHSHHIVSCLAIIIMQCWSHRKSSPLPITTSLPVRAQVRGVRVDFSLSFLRSWNLILFSGRSISRPVWLAPWLIVEKQSEKWFSGYCWVEFINLNCSDLLFHKRLSIKVDYGSMGWTFSVTVWISFATLSLPTAVHWLQTTETDPLRSQFTIN